MRATLSLCCDRPQRRHVVPSRGFGSQRRRCGGVSQHPRVRPRNDHVLRRSDPRPPRTAVAPFQGGLARYQLTAQPSAIVGGTTRRPRPDHAWIACPTCGTSGRRRHTSWPGRPPHGVGCSEPGRSPPAGPLCARARQSLVAAAFRTHTGAVADMTGDGVLARRPDRQAPIAVANPAAARVQARGAAHHGSSFEVAPWAPARARGHPRRSVFGPYWARFRRYAVLAAGEWSLGPSPDRVSLPPLADQATGAVRVRDRRSHAAIQATPLPATPLA